MTEAQWFVGMGGQQQGPLPLAQLEEMIRAGTVNHTAYVFGPGLAQWTPIMQVPQLAAMLGAPMVPPGAPPAGPAPGGVARVPDEIDYEIFGSEMQYVEITLDPGEACVSEAGAMMFMEPGIEMETVFGDGSKPQQQQGGFMDKVLSAGKRVITGESLFMTHFTNKATERRKAAFAAPYPGKIIPVDLRQHDGVMICQKDSFLVAAKGIEIGIAFQKKIGVGLFGGEGFILQKLSGQGLGFVHAGGTILERELPAGYVLRIDTGCIVAFEQQVAYDIQFVGTVKTALFGGEGLFYATLTGPGRVWLQSLPFSRIANRVFAAWGGRGPDQGSVLGGLGLGG